MNVLGNRGCLTPSGTWTHNFWIHAARSSSSDRKAFFFQFNILIMNCALATTFIFSWRTEAHLNINTVFLRYGIPMLKIRWPWDRLIFNMGIAKLVRQHLYTDTRSFDVFFDLHPNKRLSKQCWGWWFETQSCPLWRHRYGIQTPVWRDLLCWGQFISWDINLCDSYIF